uniref:EGF-like domain-containing protein n=1 Tax=Plectus sambesii TaxID=2011161 RepID=A0A914VF22_9BILA
MVAIDEPTQPVGEPLVKERLHGKDSAGKPSGRKPAQKPQILPMEPHHVQDIHRDPQHPEVKDQPSATISILPAVGSDGKPGHCTAMEHEVGDSCYCREGFVRMHGAGCK